VIFEIGITFHFKFEIQGRRLAGHRVDWFWCMNKWTVWRRLYRYWVGQICTQSICMQRLDRENLNIHFPSSIITLDLLIRRSWLSVIYFTSPWAISHDQDSGTVSGKEKPVSLIDGTLVRSDWSKFLGILAMTGWLILLCSMDQCLRSLPLSRNRASFSKRNSQV